jgi:uncharacterized membrane protein
MKGRAMADVSSSENVIAVTFEADANAYEALTLLKELDSQKQADLQGAAVVVRSEDGHVDVKDEISDGRFTGAASGGLIGLVIGIIGGPLGILLGGATGLLIGSLFDVHDADDTESVLSDISKTVRTDHTALLLQVTEQSPEVIDTAMARLGGSVLRRSVDDVEAEIAAAEKAQRAAKKEARKELRKARHEQRKEEIHAKIEELKAKLHRNKKVAATSS